MLRRDWLTASSVLLSVRYKERKMKKRQEMRKRCQALVLAGILGAGTLGSAYTAYAAGPGEMPASVGASAAGGPGETGGSGGTGNVPSASSTSENAKGADQTNPNAWKR